MKIFNILDEKAVSNINAAIEKILWSDGAETAGGYAKSIKKNLQICQDNFNAKPIFDYIKARLKADPVLSSYTAIKEVVGLRISRYPTGGKYGWHADVGIIDGRRTDLSFTISLDDAYEGGELEIDFGDFQRKIRTNVGQMVVYPTGAPHRVNEVRKGERTVIVGWINSLVRDHDDRLALFNFSQEIMALKRKVGVTDEVVKLGYIYQHFRRRLAG